MWKIIDCGEQEYSENERLILTGYLSQALDVDISDVLERRVFHVMTVDDVKLVVQQGMDIQLHTHRHRFPPNECGAHEIEDNRNVLEPLVGKRLRHFCYPSGMWSEKCWKVLTAAGVETATTCERGLNYETTSKLALKRFLDSEDISQLEFEAEITGFLELLRRLGRWTKGHVEN